jgi:hypothetical protein
MCEKGLSIGSPAATYDAYYPRDCLKLPSSDESQWGNGIHIFATLLHMHTYGRKAIARHFRGDVELPPLAMTDYYDFNYQRIVDSSRTLYPGDPFILFCFVFFCFFCFF